MCATRATPLGGRLAGEQFHLSELVRQQCRPCPSIVLVLGEQMPGEDSDLASRGESRNLLATSALDANEERPQWSGSMRCRPGGPQWSGRARAAAQAARSGPGEHALP